MKTDLEKTQHYTTESEKVCGNLIKDIPNDAQLVEPFVGGGDLLTLFPNYNWTTYDIDTNVEANFHQDTLLDIPSYINKWVITNPPFLAKNKAKDKRYFNNSSFDDLYKIALNSIIGCEGGIIIVPLNFLTDENSDDIRIKFLSEYKLINVNIFTEPVFKTTTYSVCSFSFIKCKNDNQNIHITILPQNKSIQCNIDKKYGYRLAGQEMSEINKTPNIFGRLTSTTTNNITNMKLYALDTHTERLHIAYDTNHFIGKLTDRVYLTFTTDRNFTVEQQHILVDRFNIEINMLRDKYSNLIFTNYRDWNRKRIGFTFAYKLLSKIVSDLNY